jgi:hypothetical protein
MHQQKTVVMRKLCLAMVLCSPALHGMNFLKKVENSLGKLLGKRTIQEQPQETSQKESRYKDFGYLVYAQLYNHIHERLKTEQLSDEVINASYPYYNESGMKSDIESMPVLALIFCNYGKHYGFQDTNNVQWKSLLQHMLLQENLRFDVVVSTASKDGETYSFSLLYLLLFGTVKYTHGILFSGEKISDKFIFALEALELLRRHGIKFGSKQGIVRITENGTWFYSILERLKDSYYNFDTPESNYTQESKQIFFRIIECLLDLGIDTDAWHAYKFRTPDLYSMGCFIPGGLYEGLTGLDDIIHPTTTNEYTIRILSDFRNHMEQFIAAKQSKSLGGLIQAQQARQQPLMNVFFGFQ